jgi:HAD superfamily hydrolase (TIGR01490 family)
VPSDTLVLFDLDNTLVPHDSERAFVAYLTEKRVIDAVEVAERSRELTVRYNRGEAGAIEFSEFYLGLLARLDPGDLSTLRDTWIAERVRPRIVQGMRTIVSQHQAAGDWVVVTTAVFRWLAEPQAQEFGIGDVLATEAEVDGGRFTGRVCGIANSREGKVERLREWLAARGRRLDDFRAIWVYADSMNDIALLSHATHPVAINPDPVLSAHARRAGWAVRSLPSPDAFGRESSR